MPPNAFLLLLLLLPAVMVAAASTSAGTRFDFGTLTLSSLRLLGDAHIRNGTIQLSRDLPVPGSGAGRALYSHPIRLRHPVTGTPFSFSTFFSFSITNLNPSSVGGGLAFLLSSDGRSVGDPGGFLGLLNASAPPDDPSVVVAVEFDTLMDVEFSDINGNHVGLDLNSLVSTQSADLAATGVDLRSGDLVNAWVDYDGAQQLMQVFVSYSTLRPTAPTLSLPLDLSRFVDDSMYVGFSASTQGSTEMHTVEWWSFASAGSPSTSPPPAAPGALAPTMSVSAAASPRNSTGGITDGAAGSPCSSNGLLCRRGPGAVAGVATAGVFLVAGLAGGVLLWGVSRRKRRSSRRHETLGVEVEAVARTPREFGYRELSAATRGFEASRIIGHGAFGTVYRGVMPATGAEIAVKRCTKGAGGSGQGKAEFLSELSIIAGLRHRNLVRLQGWCHEKGEILLVYDYMPNGSLDRALFDASAPALSWRQRRRILSGVASALAYLHYECERQVIHRDVKSSNVMLDEGFHARLGDFGLARQVDHGKSPDATVTAGTMGYLAPEYLLTGRATDKTDVFSFGALVLEVACGRRPIEEREREGGFGGRGRNLVEWVWGLYAEGREADAVDARVRGGDCEEAEVRRVMAVGLACSHPDAAARPGMRAVVQMLRGEAEPPSVPRARPQASFSTSTQHLLMSLQDSASDLEGGLGGGEPYSSSSSVCGGASPPRDGGNRM